MQAPALRSPRSSVGLATADRKAGSSAQREITTSGHPSRSGGHGASVLLPHPDSLAQMFVLLQEPSARRSRSFSVYSYPGDNELPMEKGAQSLSEVAEQRADLRWQEGRQAGLKQGLRAGDQDYADRNVQHRPPAQVCQARAVWSAELPACETDDLPTVVRYVPW